MLNSHCECPAGRGPHGTCKHIAAVMVMLCLFSSGKQLYIKKTCMENLQTFHQPKHNYHGKCGTLFSIKIKMSCYDRNVLSHQLLQIAEPLMKGNDY